ncbi:diaminopimelate epimerase [Natronorubrum daqingense]|uniref:Diaminopimelate epimerase n=1 Tax=Natronorubrum daqingense TaxID=588898 RepID=A0A1N6ZPH5_9EURY|nr:diaminopimelate epimerase [Natronorubrum daqingense]APX98091.1 diaminopimelate epimerase [Natronorubrum daqingense]SIR28621.1 diaminopimelate epimerase [Natronorubrum daqingense]
MTVPFQKYHGTGNDFLIIPADEYVSNRGALAERECDREEGVGADGILYLALEERFSPPRVVMTLVQPDGATAPMCGNGARCAAEWAMRRTGADSVMIDTQAGTLRADRTDGDITIEMGTPTFDPKAVPVRADEPVFEQEIEGLEVTMVNTGVPHAVAFVDDVDDIDLEAVAPPIRYGDEFPAGTNVTIASPDGSGGFDQRSYERGVEAETDSCGTGAVGIAVVARRLGRTDADPVDVHPPGGHLRVSFNDRGNATLTGPVEHEFDGEVAIKSPTEL